MNRNIRLLLFCCCLFPFNGIYAQTSDQVRYYIAYDNSGSVAITDTHNNLPEMLQRLVRVTKQQEKIETPVSFSLYSFGGTHTTLDSFIYEPHAKPTDKNQKKTSEFLKKTTHNAGQRYSHIHTALEDILRNIREEKVAAGVFIFTDGILDSGDVDPALNLSMWQYRRKVDSLIRDIRNHVWNNVFLVQTSLEERNYFDSTFGMGARSHPLLDGQDFSNRFVIRPNFCWISSSQPLHDTAGDSRMLKDFDAFVRQANIAIIAPKKMEEIKDPVAAAITVQEILPMAVGVDMQRLQMGAAERVLFDSLNRLKELLLDKGTIGKDELQATRSLIRYLTENGADLLSLKTKILAEVVRKNTTRPLDSFIIIPDIILRETYVPAGQVPLPELARRQGWENMEEELVLAFTDYVIQRAKQEAVYTFLDNMNDQLFAGRDCEVSNGADHYCFIRDRLFANVSALTEKRHIHPDFTMLQTAFRRDMKQLPENLLSNPDMLRSDGLYSLASFMLLQEAIMKTGSMEHGFRNLLSAVTRSGINVLPADGDISVRQAITFTASLISHLERYDLAAAYMHRDSLESLSRMLIVMALDSSEIVSVNMEKAVTEVYKVYERYMAVKKKMESLKILLKTPPVSDYDGYRKYQKDILVDILRSNAQLLLSGVEILYDVVQYESRDLHPDAYAFRKDVSRRIREAGQCVDAWFLLHDGAYAQAGLSLAPAIVSVFPGMTTPQQELLGTMIMIAGEVSVAKGPDDVRNIIARYAMPVASYKVKRFHSKSIMLTVYPGIGVNWYGVGAEYSIKPAIIAPVGIEYTFRICKGKSISLMGSIVDIGNVINYRLLEHDNDPKDVVRLERIFSPGVHASWGVSPKYPLAVNAGYQWNPKRLTVGAVLDMPLVSFWKKRS